MYFNLNDLKNVLIWASSTSNKRNHIGHLSRALSGIDRFSILPLKMLLKLQWIFFFFGWHSIHDRNNEVVVASKGWHEASAGQRNSFHAVRIHIRGLWNPGIIFLKIEKISKFKSLNHRCDAVEISAEKFVENSMKTVKHCHHIFCVI